MNFENYKTGRVHKLCSSVKYNQNSVHKAFIPVKQSVRIHSSEQKSAIQLVHSL